MTGKTVKMSPEERAAIRAQLHADREDLERNIKAAGSGFELIFPFEMDDERQENLEMLLKSSNKIWDDFTTGKRKGQGD